MRNTIARSIPVATALILLGRGNLPAGQLSHYNPATFNIRDFSPPKPGIHYLQDVFYYASRYYKDSRGHTSHSIVIDGRTVEVSGDRDILVITPTLIWVSGSKILGARWGMSVSTPFGNSSIGAALEAETRFGRKIREERLAFGDPFIQPLWLGWPLKHWDFSLGVGVYAPLGIYNGDADDNVGLGFWTGQFQVAGAWYPFPDRATTLSGAVTYEVNSRKEDAELTPGSHLTLNWGISQYLPISGPDLLLEFAAVGYDQWQVTDDRGSEAGKKEVHDQVHAAGLQAGLRYFPWNSFLIFRYLREFKARDRFEGDVFDISFRVRL